MDESRSVNTGNILKWDNREIKELEVIGKQVPPSLPCGTVVAYDRNRKAYIYDPNFSASGLSHYLRTSHESASGLCWLMIQRDFGYISASRKIGT